MILNRAAIIPAEEVVAFRADTSAMVTVMKGSFGWLSMSPKIHILMFHAPDFLELWGSIGLYGEEGLEAWHGRYGQNSVKFPGATELERAAGLLRAMALAREAGADEANEHRALSGAGVAITDRQCFGTSPCATPGNACSLSTNMDSKSVFYRFPLFPDPIWPDKWAAGAPCLPFVCDIIHKRI